MNAAPVLTALFNGAWQGAVLCTLAVFAFRLFRRLNATTMFTVWSVLLAIAVALPFANYAFAPKPVTVSVTRHAASATRSTAAGPDASATLRYLSVTSRRTEVTPATRRASAVSRPSLRENALTAITFVLHYAQWILLAVAVIALLRLAWLARDVVRMIKARARVRLIDPPVALSGEIGRPFEFAASGDFTSPCVLGFAPALIVIPEELLAQAGAELTSVVMHEREHVRRFDDIQNVVQRFIGAIAFFCPGVRIALRELALYREQICDDAAVNATGDRVSYAMTLTDLAQWAQGRGAPVPSLIFKRKHLMHRLEVLLDSAVSHSLRMNRRFAVAAATALVLAAAIVLRVQVPVFAETIAKPPVPPAPKIAVRAPKAAPVAPKIVVRAPKVAPMVPKVAEAVPKIAVHPVKAAPVVPNVRVHIAPVAPRNIAEIRAHVAAVAPVAPRLNVPVVHAAVFAAPAVPLVASAHGSTDLLDALNAAGMTNLSVDQLIALRDHGVSPMLVRSATSYFGRISSDDLTYLADHGVGTPYLDELRSDRVTGLSVKDAVRLMDHGVTPAFMRSAFGYFRQRPSADDLVRMADHGVSTSCIQAFRDNGLYVSANDMVRLEDNGVQAPYVAKIRHSNPRASIDDIIRLHNAGF